MPKPNIHVVWHPKGEPPYGRRNIGDVVCVPWNAPKGSSPGCNSPCCSHHRKFICRNGQYITQPGAPIRENSLYFWAEYEPASKAVIVAPSGHTPRAVHDELYPATSIKPVPCGALNTDPYVFGKFYYSCCKRLVDPTKYHKGDLILFGNYIPSNDPAVNHYVLELDTVIVFEKIIPVNDTIIQSDTQYMEAVVNRTSGLPSVIKGKEYTAGSTEPFSFVPCKFYPDHFKAAAYTKPRIDTRAMRSAADPWQYLVGSIKKQGYNFGTMIDVII